MGMHPISPHIVGPFQKWRSFRKWDKGMDVNPEDETSCTTHQQVAFLKYVENEYYAKHRCLLVMKFERLLSNNLLSSAWLLFNLPPESVMDWGQVSPNVHD